ncbi:MAG: CHASE2 domain-containing protein [Thermodesulfovibrionales bacterium]|nr:CHASE2 domain-containing protein [Thermodesulfovibrionales bacterium]
MLPIQRSGKLFIRSLLIGAGVSIFVFFLSITGYLRKWENNVFDFLMFWETEKRSSEVYLIEIDGTDYENIFNSTSPLSRKILSELVLKLSMAKPKAIGLDISFEDETSEDKYITEMLKNLKTNKTPIVFPLPKEVIKFAGISASEIDSSETWPFSHIAPSTNIFLGAIDYMQSNDSVIREMSLLKSTERDSWPSFPLSIVAAGSNITWEDFFNAINNKNQEGNEGKINQNKLRYLIKISQNLPQQIIHFIGDRKSFNTIQFSQVYRMSSESFRPGTIFTDKIVLIGGTFEESRDFYMTPKGRLAGVDIIANSIETILHENPIKPINHVLELFFELVIIIVVSYFFFRFNSLKASIISFTSIIPLAIIGSALAFSNFNHWLNFIPAMASVIIHGRIASFEHNAKLRHESESLAKRLNEQEKELLKLRRLARKKSNRKGKQR